MLQDLADQILRRAWGGVMFHISPAFSGSPFFWETSGDGETIGGVLLKKGGPDSRKLVRKEFRTSLESLRLDSLVFKIPSAQLDGDRLAGKLKLDALVTQGLRMSRRVSVGDAEFVRLAGRWQLGRFQGTEIRTEEGPVRFFDVTRQAGLTIRPGYDPRPFSDLATYAYQLLGGIAAGDFDGDGYVDLFVPRVGQNFLFRNNGNGTFTECARKLGIDNADAGASALFFDYNNDGRLDLLVVNYEPSEYRDMKTGKIVPNKGRRALVLYRNDGDRFTDVTAEAGLTTTGPATSVCAADVTGSGFLDLYVCMYEDIHERDPRREVAVPANVFAARNRVHNQLWINQGNGTFKEEAVARGVADWGWSLAAGFCDYDGDGRPDLYVANDFGEHHLYHNKGDGRFEDVTHRAGTGDTGFGMGVTWFDFDGDGKPDLYVSNMYSTAGNRILGRGPGKLSKRDHETLLKMARGNTLFRNNGDGTFEDVTAALGGGKAGWAWSSAAYDYDNDGRPDLLVTNGFRTSEFTSGDT
jgi:hypothetical protein